MTGLGSYLKAFDIHVARRGEILLSSSSHLRQTNIYLLAF